MKKFLWFAVISASFSLFSSNALTKEEDSIGKNAFDKACSGCHGEKPIPRAMSRAQMAKLPPEKIYSALTEGLMLLQASALNNLEHRAVSLYLSEIEWGTVEKVNPEDKVVFCDSAIDLNRAK